MAPSVQHRSPRATSTSAPVSTCLGLGGGQSAGPSLEPGNVTLRGKWVLADVIKLWI